MIWNLIGSIGGKVLDIVDDVIVWSGDNEPKDVDQLLEKAVGKCQHLSGIHEIK